MCTGAWIVAIASICVCGIWAQEHELNKKENREKDAELKACKNLIAVMIANTTRTFSNNEEPKEGNQNTQSELSSRTNYQPNTPDTERLRRVALFILQKRLGQDLTLEMIPASLVQDQKVYEYLNMFLKNSILSFDHQ